MPEIPNAYVFAVRNGLRMPSGVLAMRPASGSRDARKVGGYSQDSSLRVVNAVEDGQYADLLLGYRDNRQQRTKWRAQRGTPSGETLDFVSTDGNRRTTFIWSDANSGKLSMVPQGGGNNRIVNTTLGRLD